MAKDSMLYNVDTGKLDALMKDTDENVKYFIEISDKVANEYTKHLDEIMQSMYKVIINPDDITDKQLEKYMLELTSLIYFTGSKLEKLGVYDDMSDSAYKEVYNRAYLDNTVKDATDKKNKTTVAELTAIAEKTAQYESVVNSIYERAYKTVKFKIESASKMIDTIKKVVSRRMQEQQLTINVGNMDMMRAEEEAMF